MKKEYLKYFENYLIDIKISKSAGTYKYYENHFLNIGRYFFENNIEKLEDVNRDIFVGYLSGMKETCSNNTINKRVGVLKRCFRYYNLNDSYIHTVEKLREKRVTFDMVSNEDMKRIVKYITSLPEKDNNLLYKGIILLLVNTGVRLTELYNIEKRNINLSGNEILLTKTKTGIDRTVYFRPVIAPVIKKLMDLKHDHKFLLHNQLRNRQVNYSDISYLFKKIKRDLSIRKLHPHMFRHSFATNLLRYGVDIKTVMDLMGHTNLSTTQRYQHSSKEHAKKSYLDKYKY